MQESKSRLAALEEPLQRHRRVLKEAEATGHRWKRWQDLEKQIKKATEASRKHAELEKRCMDQRRQLEQSRSELTGRQIRLQSRIEGVERELRELAQVLFVEPQGHEQLSPAFRRYGFAVGVKVLIAG